MTSKQTANNQTGFTIVELMIATAILSTILLLVTAMMINIGNLYYKGVNQARVQDGVRTIADDVTQQLKFGDLLTGGPWTVGSGVNTFHEQAYCIGNIRYTYILGYQIGTGIDYLARPQAPHVLWRDTNPSPGSCTEVDLTASPSGGTELIPPNSRLTSFSITTSYTSAYAVTVGVAYGGMDLLTLPYSASPIDNLAADPPIFVTCKGLTGDQFCATAHLTTIVTQRITGS
jgi:prepilin-type N-terminal cleavage/methylation domain-containing protein